MPSVPNLITDLSTTAASNAPAGTDSPSILDDVQRAHASFIAQIVAGLASMIAKITGGTINGATIGATTPSSGAFTTVSATGASSGASLTAMSLSNTGAGVNTKSRIDFFAAGSRYAGMAGGYGPVYPELSWDISGTDLMKLTATGGLVVTGSISATSTISPQQATTAGAPAYVKGAIYFDTTLNKLRVGGATAWETITST